MDAMWLPLCGGSCWACVAGDCGSTVGADVTSCLQLYHVAVCHTFRVGDICVSPYSVNWDCRQASYLQTCGVSQGGNQCVYPEQNYDASASYLFGQCEFYNITKGELALADEVLAALAAKGNQYLPRRNGIVQVGPGHAWQHWKLCYKSQ